jgi:uncharacterized SAM-binding protein YcdF (DUF218 family)
MAVGLLVLWIALLSLLYVKQRAIALKATLIMGMIGLLALGYGYPTGYLLRSLQAGFMANHDEWQHDNIILLLGAGVEEIDAATPEVHMFGYSRVAKAASLYRSCKDSDNHCVVLVSGGDPVGAGVSEAAVYAAALQSLGVTASDLALETQSKNTWENAKFSSHLIARMPASHLVLVSSATHLRRSALYARHFGLKPDALVRADYLRTVHHTLPQAYNLLAFDLAFHEYMGIVRFHVYERLGWNGESVEPKLKTLY